jgi:beta-lactamase superfamily II metal-dependent hydrolase
MACYQYFQFYDNKLHVVFCNVGQGDAAFIKTPGGSTILIDGGPDNSVLQCLKNHLPFWKRTISVIVLTHPHADHLQGFLYVFDRYTVNTFVTEDLKNKTFSFNTLMQKVRDNKSNLKYVLSGDAFHLGEVTLTFIGPTESFLHITSPTGMIGESKEFASIETLVSFKTFSALLTGDSQADELADSLKNVPVTQLSVLHIPHHGSASGLTRELLDTLNPKLGVISVGENNTYHLPNPFTLSLLKEFQLPLKRTDENGDIEIVSDGEKWWNK